MSKKFINKTIEDLGLDNSLKIFYDFNDYSGSYINSIELGESNYSGNIVNHNTNFTGQSSGSGFFNGQYIEIENTSGIASENATILFSQQKTGTSNGVIFSHMDANGPSGWEIGINEANKYYFKNHVNGSPTHSTLPSYLHDKNICAFTIGEFGFGELFRLNFEKPQLSNSVDELFQETTPESQIVYHQFDTQSFNVLSHSVSNGSSWRIGSGEFLYEGYIDYFMYFDQKLNDDQLRKIVHSMHSDYTITPEVSGTISGSVTGYAISGTEVSGEVGKPWVSTGQRDKTGYYTYESGIELTGCVGISGIVYVPYTGISEISGTNQIGQTIYREVHNLSNIFEITGGFTSTGLSNYESSGDYWHFSGNSGTFKGLSSTGPNDTIFGITGFDIVTVTGYTSGQKFEQYTTGSTSGKLYDVYTKSGIREPDINYLATGEEIVYGSNTNPEYFADSISLIDQSNEEYFYEIVYDVDESETINNSSPISLNTKYNKLTSRLTGIFDPHYMNYAVNGVSSFTGLARLSKNEYNFPLINIESGFFVSGSEVFPEVNLEQQDNALYDIIHSGDKDNLVIDDVADYSNRPFTDFDFANADVFLNGVKLYSGIDYIDNGGFYPINNSIQVTGVYFTYPKYSGAQSFTGYSEDPITLDHAAINPNSYFTFYNGIRQPQSNIIAHARSADLISGTLINIINQKIYTKSK